MKPAATERASASRLWLRHAFTCAVVAFAWWRFSDNTADNDLWGHVLYGQRMLARGGLETVESLSWTAQGLPWINHEVLAEIVLGLTHRAAGGAGLWGLMVALAIITVGWAWREGAGREATSRVVALGLLALSTNFVALGYAVRPQLFTYLFFVGLLVALRRLLNGNSRWGWTIPPLLALWTNTHGGYLAGWLTLAVAAACELLSPVVSRSGFAATGVRRPLLLTVAALGTLALLLNPWGWHLVAWTLATVRLPRPTITEWQPLLPSFATIPFYATLALGLASWVLTRLPRRLWECGVWLLFGALAIQHQRHAPLFGLATLVLLPGHVTDLLSRLVPATATLRRLAAHSLAAGVGAVALLLAATACLIASVRPPKVLPFCVEIPRDTFPVAAIEQLRARRLTGKTVTFFDWGQQVLWELPDNPVSFDGRLDTVYPPAIMEAHWRLYAGEEPGPALDLAQAEVALLPTGSGGVTWLTARGWHPAYIDPLATILTRRTVTAVRVGVVATRGRVAFPGSPPALAARASP